MQSAPVSSSVPSAPYQRQYVYSGLENFRAVIEAVNETHIFKFVCCNRQCQGSQAADRSEQLKRGAGDEIHLFNMAASNWNTDGRFERPSSDLAGKLPDLVAKYAALLPRRDRAKAYYWEGCNLTGWTHPPKPPHPHTNLNGSWNLLDGRCLPLPTHPPPTHYTIYLFVLQSQGLLQMQMW